MLTSACSETPWPATLRCLLVRTMWKKPGESLIHCSSRIRQFTHTSLGVGDRVKLNVSRLQEDGKTQSSHLHRHRLPVRLLEK